MTTVLVCLDTHNEFYADCLSRNPGPSLCLAKQLCRATKLSLFLHLCNYCDNSGVLHIGFVCDTYIAVEEGTPKDILTDYSRSKGTFCHDALWRISYTLPISSHGVPFIFDGKRRNNKRICKAFLYQGFDSQLLTFFFSFFVACWQ